MRAVLSFISLVLFQLLALRCKKDAKSDLPRQGKDVEESPESIDPTPPSQQEEPQTPKDTITAPPSPPSPLFETCDAGKMPLERIPTVGESLEVTYRTYGPKEKATVGFTLLKYQHRRTPIKEMFICGNDGSLVAQRGFSAFSDLNEDESVRAMAIENLNLSKFTSFYFVIVLEDQRTFKAQSAAPWTVSSEYKGKGITSARAGNQRAFPNTFGPTKGSIFTPGAESMSAFSTDQMRALNSFRNVIVTDIAGREISPLGQDFTEYLAHPIFVVYELVDNRRYHMTVARVG